MAFARTFEGQLVLNARDQLVLLVKKAAFAVGWNLLLGSRRAGIRPVLAQEHDFQGDLH
jgi:hypothetical protein